MSTRRAEQAARGAAAHVDLILLTRDGDRFVLYVESGGRLNYPRLTIRRGDNIPDNLNSLVSSLAVEQLGIDVTCLGLVTYDMGSQPCKLVAAAMARQSWEVAPSDAKLRVLTVAEMRARGQDLEYGSYFDMVRRWHEVDSSSSHLGIVIQRAMDTSISYLDRHLAVEDDHWGWNQYLDGDSVGMLSTAEGLLAHVHAGTNGEFVDRPARTIEAMQNPDGGWQVRRALVGAHSNVSITESTCTCLWALYEMGRSVADEPVRHGIAWLETLQRPDGGWPSSARGTESLVFPTTSAVRILSSFKRTEAVAKGAAWLRSKQAAEGGWGATAPESRARSLSAPAYTSYSVVALLTAGLPAEDKTIAGAVDYLRSTFNPNEPEPWEPTSFTSLIDPPLPARLDFRHFTTPWALAALCLAGGDLSDHVVFQATRSLLRLQESSGAWRCGLTAPGDTPLWAIHDALYALRMVLNTSIRNLGPISLSQYLTKERVAMQHLTAHLLRQEIFAGQTGPTRRNWLQTGWMSALTVCVVVLVLAQVGLFRQFQSSSGLHKAWTTVVAAAAAAIGAISPAIITEEYRIRRERAIARSRNSDGN